MMTAYALTIMVNEVRDAIYRAVDAFEACPDPADIIDEASYGKALRDAGIDDRSVYGKGDPVYMIGQVNFGPVNERAHRLLIDEEDGRPHTSEEQAEIDDLYVKMDVLRIFLLGVAKAAEKKTKEMCGRW